LRSMDRWLKYGWQSQHPVLPLLYSPIKMMRMKLVVGLMERRCVAGVFELLWQGLGLVELEDVDLILV